MLKRRRHSTISPISDRVQKRERINSGSDISLTESGVSIEKEQEFVINELIVNSPIDLSKRASLTMASQSDKGSVSGSVSASVSDSVDNTDVAETQGNVQGQCLSVTLCDSDVQRIAIATQALLSADIQGLITRVRQLEIQNTQLIDRIDELEQYQRRNNIVISGLSEADDESKDDLHTKVTEFAEKVGADISNTDIDSMNRLGKPSQDKSRPILVRLTNRSAKKRITKSRPLFKKKGFKKVFVNEDLTKPRQALAFETRKFVKQGYGTKTWTDDGKVFVLDNNEKKHRVYNTETLQKIHESTSFIVTTRPTSSMLYQPANITPLVSDRPSFSDVIKGAGVYVPPDSEMVTDVMDRIVNSTP